MTTRLARRWRYVFCGYIYFQRLSPVAPLLLSKTASIVVRASFSRCGRHTLTESRFAPFQFSFCRRDLRVSLVKIRSSNVKMVVVTIVEVETKLAGLIIGRRGATIQRIQKNTRTKIVLRDGPTDDICTIRITSKFDIMRIAVYFAIFTLVDGKILDARAVTE